MSRLTFDDLKRCHDCGVLEGEIHKPGCDAEACPFCAELLWCCGCGYDWLQSNFPSADLERDAPSEEMQAMWEAALKEKETRSCSSAE